ncbi:MAG: AAA family ATPase [Nitrospirae bacterium]|nr:AAA family ATPase [Nitrospirota bacterium]
MEYEEEIEELRRLSKEINDLYYSGKDKEGEAILIEALKKSKDIEAYHLFFEGELAGYKNKDYIIQEKLFRKAIEIRPLDFFLIRNLGVSLSFNGKEEDAIRYYDEALKIKPDDYNTLNNKGVTLSNQGKDKEAIELYDEVLKIKPDYYATLINKGASLSKLGKVEDAIRCLQEAQKVKADGEDKGLSQQDKEEVSILKLKRIELKGFKSIDSEGQRVEFGDVTVLIGPNGAGKSNFISFFKMINAMTDERLRLHVGINGGTSSFLYFGHETTPSLSAEIVFTDDKETIKDSYRFNLSHTVEDLFKINNEEIVYQKDELPEEHKVLQTVGLRESALKDLSRESAGPVRVTYNLLRKCLVYQFHDTSIDAKIRGRCNISGDSSLLDDGSNLASILYAMADDSATLKYYKRIVSRINAIFPQFDDFVLEPIGKEKVAQFQTKLKWKVKNSDHIFAPFQISDGSLRFMALATLLLQPPHWLPPVIIIDEPELGLHPTAISDLAGMVKSASRHAQVIIATQSARLLDEFEPNQIVVVEYVDRHKRTEFIKQNKYELAEWLDRYTLSELWDKNVLGGKP